MNYFCYSFFAGHPAGCPFFLLILLIVNSGAFACNNTARNVFALLRLPYMGNCSSVQHSCPPVTGTDAHSVHPIAFAIPVPPIAIGYWIAKNKCERMTTEKVDGLNKENGRSIIKHKFSGGPTGCEVWLYEVINGPHSWFDHDIDTGEEIWSFFSKYIE